LWWSEALKRVVWKKRQVPEDFEYRNLHPELHATLLHFHQINGKRLKAVWRFYEGTDLDKVMLSFDEESLLIEAEPYDDTIVISVLHNDECRTEGWLASSERTLSFRSCKRIKLVRFRDCV
jgi:hypothetical protein